MRLLHVQTLTFKLFQDQRQRPPYAILSHKWRKYEPTLQDIEVNRARKRPTADCSKIFQFAEYVALNLPNIQWVWVDTCCIKQDSLAELSESVNLMFDYYRQAAVCLAYLPDVKHEEDYMAFRRSVWFTRGWTLPELLAPKSVIFVTDTWQTIGHKGSTNALRINTGPNLEGLISDITKIPQDVLHDFTNSRVLSHSQKFEWMERRETLRPEDKSYALFGIMGVAPGTNYGERAVSAERRLLAAVLQNDEQYRSMFPAVVQLSRW